MVNVSVMGVTGRMGRSILNLLNQDSEIDIVGATEAPGHGALGVDAGTVAGIGDIGVSIVEDIAQASERADVIVDFTAPGPTLKSAGYAAANGKSIVIGTTGFTDEEKKRLEGLCSQIPCVIAPNMSIGVNVVFEMTKKLAQVLGDDYDVEIIEAHHKHKMDSPSGTALRLGEAAAEGLKRNFSEVSRFERYGNIGERPSDEIGMQTIRGGDIVGEHTVMFCGQGERVELTHRAWNRDNFAKGVLRATKWLNGKAPGIYTMKDVLGL